MKNLSATDSVPVVKGSGGCQGIECEAKEGKIKEPVSDVVRMLERSSDPRQRQAALTSFLKHRQDVPGFFEIVKETLFRVAYPEITQRLLLFMIQRYGVDLPFLFDVINRAVEEKNFSLARQGFHVLEDVLIQYPDKLAQRSELSYEATAGSAFLNRSRKVLTAFLALTAQDSLGAMHLLRSPYWTLQDLADIYHALRAQGRDDSKKVSSMIRNEMLRRNILANQDKGYRNVPLLGFLNFNQNALPVLLEKENNERRRFLSTSPEWDKMEVYISSDLFKTAVKEVDRLLSSRTSPTTMDLWDVGDSFMLDINRLASFDSLGVKAKKKYIADIGRVPELARIFKSFPSLRRTTFDRLMETPLGRMFVLQTYTESDDPSVLSLVETRSWFDYLIVDELRMRDPVTMKAWRDALVKMNHRTGQAWLLNARFELFTDFELHARSGEPNESQKSRIMMRALRRAVDVVLAGKASQDMTPSQRTLIDEVKGRLCFACDLLAVNKYLEEQQDKGDEAVKGLAQDIVVWRKKIYGMIIKGDANFSSEVSFSYWLHGVVVSVFGFLGFFFWKRQRFLKKSTIKQLREELGKSFPKESSIRHDDDRGTGLVQVPWTARLNLLQQKWRDVLNLWIGDSGNISSSSLNQVLNYAFKILQSSLYSSDLMGIGDTQTDGIRNEAYRKIFSEFNLLAIDTLMILDQFLRGKQAEEQDKFIFRSRDVIMKMVEYVNFYLRVLEWRAHIDKMMALKYSDSHPLETMPWSKEIFGKPIPFLFPLFRLLLFDARLLSKCMKGLEKDLKLLLVHGQALMPGAYGDTERQGLSFSRSMDLLSSVVKGAKSFLSPLRAPVRNQFKFFTFYKAGASGFKMLSMFFFPFLVVYSLFWGASNLTFMGAMGTLTAIGFLLGKQHYVTDMFWSKITNRLIEKFKESSREDNSTAEGVIVELAINDRRDQIQKELTALAPGVGMVVIVMNADKNDGSASTKERLNSYIAGRRGILFRNDIPVEVINAQGEGSANAYFSAMRFVYEKIKDNEFAARYSHLRERANDDVRVLFVLAGNDKNEDDNIMDLAVANGFQMFAAMNKDQGGHVVVYSRDAYFGQIPSSFGSEDIHFLGEWVNSDALLRFGFLKVDSDGIVGEIFEKLNIDRLKKEQKKNPEMQKAILNYLDEHYNLGRLDLRQFPVATGLMGFSPKAVRVLSDILSKMDANPDLLSKLKYLHMTNDVLNVFFKNSEGLNYSYLGKRLFFDDIARNYPDSEPEKLRPHFIDLYKMIIDTKTSVAAGEISAEVFMPSPGTSILIQSGEQGDDAVRIGNLMSAAGGLLVMKMGADQIKGAVDQSAGEVDTGGLDFSMTADAVEFKEDNVQIPVDSEVVHARRLSQFLQLFRGFDFEIINLHSVENFKIFFSAH